MKLGNGNVTSAKGFKAAGNAVGLKKVKKDMAIITSEVPAVTAGCFTTNVVKAAPVLWDMSHMGKKINGIVVNSGNANACTGEQGLKDAEATAECLASLMGKDKDSILVCSTGVIGVNLDMNKMLAGVKATYSLLNDSEENGALASEAIMTTDTYAKTISAEIELGGKKVILGAMAKGCGMINPNMATMLCFIATDCAISAQMLDRALKACVADTFNMITVDGDTSTNDTVLALANGMAGNEEITAEGADYEAFKEALFAVSKDLAIKCVDDGEGATKLMEVIVNGAATREDARTIASSVTSSNLFKAALFGEDANWGRVLCAMGYSGAKFNPMGVTIHFRSEGGKIMLMDNGSPIIFDEELASKILKEHKIIIDIDLSEGSETATAWGCDLTYDYVKINGDYRS